jgi:hypothetical protein
MSTIPRGAEPVMVNLERREPRCRICREEPLRVVVNKLLDWHRVPIIMGPGKTHLVTYADILRDLEPLTEGRDERHRITYDSLWIHAKRHYELAGTAAYWSTRMSKEFKDFKKALRTNGGVERLSSSHSECGITYQE